MIDIHCHILPGIDDGPPDTETSLRMLRMAAEDGITHIAATPHFRCGERPGLEEIAAALKLLQEAAGAEQVPVALLRGADVKISYELLDGLDRKEVPTINHSRYLLIELPDILPPRLDDVFFEIRLKGYVPVITHPERNYSFLASPEKLEPLREAGALFQITAMSVTGDFGQPVMKFCRMLLKKRLIDFIASDAHNVSKRVPVLSKAYRALVKAAGVQEASRIFHINPLSVIEDREII